MNALQVFTYNGAQVRTVEQNGEPWWVLKNVCEVLGLDSPHKVAERLDEDERNLIPLTDSLDRQQNTTIISESGLYNVILRSDKPEAKPFRKWVTAEVLPAIRRNGSYISNAEELIAKTATAVVGEVMKQIVPILQRLSPYYDPLEDLRAASIAAPLPRRKAAPGIIRRLDEDVRRQVDDMMLTDKFSYDDIREYLARFGIAISNSAICRYRKSFYR